MTPPAVMGDAYRYDEYGDFATGDHVQTECNVPAFAVVIVVAFTAYDACCGPPRYATQSTGPHAEPTSASNTTTTARRARPTAISLARSPSYVHRAAI